MKFQGLFSLQKKRTVLKKKKGDSLPADKYTGLQSDVCDSGAR